MTIHTFRKVVNLKEGTFVSCGAYDVPPIFSKYLCELNNIHPYVETQIVNQDANDVFCMEEFLNLEKIICHRSDILEYVLSKNLFTQVPIKRERFLSRYNRLGTF